jgi:glucose-6-phosphate isomerase
MGKISIDYSNAMQFINQEQINELKNLVIKSHDMLHNKTGQGSDYLGWLNLPNDYNKDEFDRIKKAAEKIKSDSDVLIVIGIGGSYLGARAVIDALSHNFYNCVSSEKRKTPQVFFTGNNMSSTYLSDLLDVIEGKRISINVISKSGTTTEPAISFRIFKNYMEQKYGKEEANKRIYVTTDKAKGALKKLSSEEGYETFVIPDDIGGRYSVLTAVGLLPIAVSGIDIDKLMEGAQKASEIYDNTNIENNDCYKYALIRNALYRNNKTTEIMVNYEPALHYFTEWWKQLYGDTCFLLLSASRV